MIVNDMVIDALSHYNLRFVNELVDELGGRNIQYYGQVCKV